MVYSVVSITTGIHSPLILLAISVPCSLVILFGSTVCSIFKHKLALRRRKREEEKAQAFIINEISKLNYKDLHGVIVNLKTLENTYSSSLFATDQLSVDARNVITDDMDTIALTVKSATERNQSCRYRISKLNNYLYELVKQKIKEATKKALTSKLTN